ncbi:MAG TPA: hypothetical protein VLJ19_19825 [Variovorax sp.]|nr:hypothetical protein [Variovorax sp.]
MTEAIPTTTPQNFDVRSIAGMLQLLQQSLPIDKRLVHAGDTVYRWARNSAASMS